VVGWRTGPRGSVGRELELAAGRVGCFPKIVLLPDPVVGCSFVARGAVVSVRGEKAGFLGREESWYQCQRSDGRSSLQRAEKEGLRSSCCYQSQRIAVLLAREERRCQAHHEVGS
jgi:hypothetical protein